MSDGLIVPVDNDHPALRAPLEYGTYRIGVRFEPTAPRIFASDDLCRRLANVMDEGAAIGHSLPSSKAAGLPVTRLHDRWWTIDRIVEGEFCRVAASQFGDLLVSTRRLVSPRVELLEAMRQAIFYAARLGRAIWDERRTDSGSANVEVLDIGSAVLSLPATVTTARRALLVPSRVTEVTSASVTCTPASAVSAFATCAADIAARLRLHDEACLVDRDRLVEYLIDDGRSASTA